MTLRSSCKWRFVLAIRVGRGLVAEPPLWQVRSYWWWLVGMT